MSRKLTLSAPNAVVRFWANAEAIDAYSPDLFPKCQIAATLNSTTE